MANASPAIADTLGARVVVSLGLVAFVGPSSVDMYLASLPAMAQEFHISYASVQLSLTVFLVAMGLGQLLCGPVIDAVGRKRPLIAGLVVFIMASVWSAHAGSIEELLCSRLLQGLCAAMTLVVVMSVVRDLSDGANAARIFGLLMAIQGLAPVIAPAAGGFIGAVYGWRSVMLVLACLGLVALIYAMASLPETLPPHQRLSVHPLHVFRSYRQILANRRFLLAALALSATFFLLFTYIGGAPLVYQHRYGLSPQAFGLVFGATGVAILLGALISGQLARRFDASRLAVGGSALMVAGAAVACAASLASLGLPGVVGGIVVAMLGLGIAESAMVSMAMGSQDVALGSTAALLGAMQLVVASGATPVAGAMAELGATHWLSALIVISGVVLFLALLTAKGFSARAHALVEP